MVEHARRLGLMTCELNRQSFDEIIQLHIGSSLFAKNKFSFTLKGLSRVHGYLFECIHFQVQ